MNKFLLKSIRNVERTIKKREIYLRDIAKYMDKICRFKSNKFKFMPNLEYEIKSNLDDIYFKVRSHYFYIENLNKEGKMYLHDLKKQLENEK